MSKPAVLFVCLGNICRSPLAEATFRRAAQEVELEVETASAGTADYHVGEPPDRRAIAEAHTRGIDISGYRGRQLKASDFKEFDYILAMDSDNLANIRRLDPGDGKARTALLLDLVPGQQGREVADPYYGGDDGFTVTFDEVEAGARALVAVLLDGHG